MRNLIGRIVPIVFFVCCQVVTTWMPLIQAAEPEIRGPICGLLAARAAVKVVNGSLENTFASIRLNTKTKTASYLTWLAMGIPFLLLWTITLALDRFGWYSAGGLTRFASIAVATSVLAVTCQFLSLNDQLSKSGYAEIEAIVRAATPHSIPTVGISDLTNIESEFALVDSRYRRDFVVGSIPNSINIPVDITDSEFVRRASTLTKDQHIIVFCQSETCHFSDQISKRFMDLGFDRVVVLREGYAGWKRQ